MNGEKTRLCPFKKQIKRTIRRGKHGEPDMTVSERCMAYKAGHCLRLESSEGIPLKRRERK